MLIKNHHRHVDELWSKFENQYKGKEDNFYQELDKYILKTWNKKNPVEDKDKTKEFIEIFHFLIYSNGLLMSIEKIIKVYQINGKVCDKAFEKAKALQSSKKMTRRK